MSDKKISSQDKELFHQAMDGVKPIKPNKKIENKQIKPPTVTKRMQKDTYSKRNESNAQYLSDYINEPVLDNTVLSYQHHPLPLKRMKQLKKGDIPFQSKLDLHGYRSEEAKSKLLDHLNKARQEGIRCVLIIHGKGSYGGEPPRLKNLVNVWLQQIPEVIAFHSAIPKDGGTGALYVLLKR